MDGVQFFLLIGGVIALFIVVEYIGRFIWPDKDRELIEEWQAIQKTLDQPGASVPDEFWNKVSDRTSAKSASARQPSRTLRGDITRLWALCKRITKTKS